MASPHAAEWQSNGEVSNMTLSPFEGTERFEIRGRLGAGTSGEVYRAYDKKLRTPVALKLLHRADPSSLYLFKREFRSLTGVTHRNLVKLYELLSDGQRWFFTMELVEGPHLVEFVRGPEEKGSGSLSGGPPASAPADLERLRGALIQLAEGLRALHAAGKLHCDVKPSNVRVDTEGRVVLLDFGLVQELFGNQSYETMSSDITGTPAYMSPEQAAGDRVTAASDWYGAGVVLFEALTGRRPFSGGFVKILREKQVNDSPRVETLVPGLPEDLCELCGLLLARDPAERPDGKEVLARLGAAVSSRAERSALASSTGDLAPFIGRERQLQTLIESFEATRGGRTAVVHVHGSSGLGKTALVQRFLDRVRHEHEEAVILAGKCYERESVPYKALDALIDTLTRYLNFLPRGDAEVLLPTNVLALARLFPALRRVEAVRGAQRQVLEIPDEREQKRRARAALRELLVRLAERKPVILYIDDLQWGDAESADLLIEILQPPDPPPLMLLTCFRSEERHTSPLLQRLLRIRFEGGEPEVHELSIGELDAQECYEMALLLLGETSPEVQVLAREIAHESGGNPFFISELVRYWQTEAELGDDPSSGLRLREVTSRGHMSLERLILARLEKLPAEAQELFEVVAVAGRPVDLEAAVEAAAIEHDAQAAVTFLRSASLIRIRGSRAQEIESYHDRIREAVAHSLDDRRLAGLHLRLAQALEATGRGDPETLATHFYEAGERERAAEFATAAARQAQEALAFERAARLYRRALELEVHDRDGERALQIQLGDALANAGRGAEAAEAYLTAAEGAKAAEALEMRRRAAEQQLASGYMDEGLETVRAVLASIGMKLAKTPRRALLSLLVRRLHLKFRGLRFKERSSDEIPAETLIKIDTCWAVARGLGTVDTIRGMDFGTRHLLLALEAGEPYRVARALAIETAYSGIGGTRSKERTAKLVKAAMTLAERVNHPHALGLANGMAGVAAFLEGDWRRACEFFDRGENILREHCAGVAWELDTILAYRLRALLVLGELGEIIRLLPGVLKDVREKGDRFAETNLRTRVVWLAHLAADKPDDAEREVEKAIQNWTQKAYHLQHYWHLTALAEISLYRGEGRKAWEIHDEGWPKVLKAGFLRIQYTFIEAWHWRARTALAALLETDAGPEAQKLVKVVEEGIQSLEKEDLPYGRPLAQLIRAGLATWKGEGDPIENLVTAAAGFESADMGLFVAVSRRRRGQLLGRAEGRNFIQDAERWMSEQGIQNPEQMSAVLAPGRWV